MIFSIIFLSLSYAQMTYAQNACPLQEKQVHKLLRDYADRHYYDLTQLVGQEKLDHIALYIENKTFYSNDHNRYFLPLTAIKTQDITGSVWLEVTCDLTLSLSYYVEEI